MDRWQILYSGRSQLKGSGITLYKSGEPEVPTIEEFLKKELEEGAVLGFDGRTVSYAQGEKISTDRRRGRCILSNFVWILHQTPGQVD